MKIEIASPSGYCQGVKLAILKAKELRKKYPKRKIIVLGMLVHNDDAINELKKEGIETLYKSGVPLFDLVDDIEEDALVILTAHGHPKEVEDKLATRKIEFIDATCPMVEQVQKEIKKAILDNHQVIYLGIRNHPEAISATSISKNVYLYDVNKDDFDYSFICDNNPLIITQTTLSSDLIEEIIEKIQSRLPSSRVLNSVCVESKRRQNALKNLADDIELILLVGGKSSNNTKTLFELAKNNYPNKTVLKIENLADLKIQNLNLNYKNTFILGGASTPYFVLEEIANYLKTIE